MTWLSEAKNWLENLAANHPDPAIQSAAASLSTAVTQTEAAIPVVAADIANVGISMIPGGALVEGIADSFIEAILGEFLAKATNPAQVLAGVTATANAKVAGTATA